MNLTETTIKKSLIVNTKKSERNLNLALKKTHTHAHKRREKERKGTERNNKNRRQFKKVIGVGKFCTFISIPSNNYYK